MKKYGVFSCFREYYICCIFSYGGFANKSQYLRQTQEELEMHTCQVFSKERKYVIVTKTYFFNFYIFAL